MRLSDLVKALELAVLSGADELDVDISRVYVSDILSDVNGQDLQGNPVDYQPG